MRSQDSNVNCRRPQAVSIEVDVENEAVSSRKGRIRGGKKIEVVKSCGRGEIVDLRRSKGRWDYRAGKGGTTNITSCG